MIDIKDYVPDPETEKKIDADIEMLRKQGHELNEIDILGIKATHVMGVDPMKEAFSMPKDK